MSKYDYKIASNKDAQIIKDLINQMYGVEYEIRDMAKFALQNLEKKLIIKLKFTYWLMLMISV